MKMTDELRFLIYKSNNGDVSVNAFVLDDTIWMTQAEIVELFQSSKANISEHIANIFADGELAPEATVQIRTVQSEGKRSVERNLEYYNLDMIIAVGYRVNTKRATCFRQWATSVLKEYMLKGFALDDERLKQGRTLFGKDYFRELLERVRSIRASERRIWQQITDIFAECSLDYDKNSQTARDFYATIQNKFHFAITGQTAAEIIFARADRQKEHMGLTVWKNSPNGRILKSDVTIAKNYLDEEQIKRLERAVVGYFDYIEDLIERENVFSMEEFAESVNEFLAFRRYQILKDKGKIAKSAADAKAEEEYDHYNKTQKIVSDFDLEIKRLTQQSKRGGRTKNDGKKE